MKNKKGFTLVELIAVIGIMALLMILVLPTILDTFKKGRMNAFVTEARSIHREAVDRYTVDRIKNLNNNVYCVGDTTVNALDVSSNENLKYRVTFSNGSMTSFVVDNGQFRIELVSDFSIDEIKIKNDGTLDESGTVECGYTPPVTAGGSLWEKILTDNPTVCSRTTGVCETN